MMKTRIAIGIVAILVLATPLLAQDEGEKFDVVKAMKQVSELLKQSESALVGSLKPGEETTGTAAEKGEAARKSMERLLESSRKSGEDAVKQMTEILKKAPQSSSGGGGGRDQKRDQGKKDQDQKEQNELGKRDPQNSKKGAKDPAEQKKKGEDKTKPNSKAEKAREPDPARDWMAGLPPQVREAVKNRDWGRIPARWKEYVEEYQKRISEAESSRRGE